MRHWGPKRAAQHVPDFAQRLVAEVGLGAAREGRHGSARGRVWRGCPAPAERLTAPAAAARPVDLSLAAVRPKGRCVRASGAAQPHAGRDRAQEAVTAPAAAPAAGKHCVAAAVRFASVVPVTVVRREIESERLSHVSNFRFSIERFCLHVCAFHTMSFCSNVGDCSAAC